MKIRIVEQVGDDIASERGRIEGIRKRAYGILEEARCKEHVALRKKEPEYISETPLIGEIYRFEEWGVVHCEVCGEYLGWYCPDSPDLVCHYDYGASSHGGCIHCGNPDERK